MHGAVGVWIASVVYGACNVWSPAGNDFSVRDVGATERRHMDSNLGDLDSNVSQAVVSDVEAVNLADQNAWLDCK